MIGTDSRRAAGLLLVLIGLASTIAYEVRDWRAGEALILPTRSKMAPAVKTVGRLTSTGIAAAKR